MLYNEDMKIRRRVLVGSAFAITVFLAVVLVVTIMIATNFNLLNWLE